jgi:hypothetical protein
VRDGAFFGGEGANHPRGLRDLHREGLGSRATGGAGGGHGQPLGPQGSSGQGADRGEGLLRASLPAALLAQWLNPIEQAFAKIKGLLRKAEARSREALVEAMGQALDAVTPRDAEGYLEHRGY